MGDILGTIYWMFPSWLAIGIFALLCWQLKSRWKWLGLIPVTAVVVVNSLFIYWLANFKM